MEKDTACYLCGSTRTLEFVQTPPVPTQDGIMCATEEDAAKCAKGNIRLSYCTDCSYTGNEGYEAEKISFADYDFSLDHSPLFNNYIYELSEYLIDTHNLHNKLIIDIGCGDGHFLTAICQKGSNAGVGIDSGFDHSKRKSINGVNIQFFRDYYSEKYFGLKADLVTCRLVIDLLADPISFLKTIRKNIDNHPDTVVFFEVPNALYTFGEKIIWNIVYEHRSWFTPPSLRYLLEKCGFEVIKVMPLWKGEFLGIEARAKTNHLSPSLPDKEEIMAFSRVVKSFGEVFSKMVHQQKSKIEEIKNQNLKTIAWGAGARAVTFFNFFEVKELIPFVADINVKRHGKYLPGSGQKIVSPSFLNDYRPDIVLITNPTYAAEIKEQIAQLGLSPKFWIL